MSIVKNNLQSTHHSHRNYHTVPTTLEPQSHDEMTIGDGIQYKKLQEKLQNLAKNDREEILDFL